MNSSIHDLFNDIFSNEHDLDYFLNCMESEKCSKDAECQSEPWLKRLGRFYDDFLRTEEGLEYRRWLPVPYNRDSFVDEYVKWFYFFHYFQKKVKIKGHIFLFKRLLFFQPLFLTKPFIFYIKRILRLNYFYTYFVDLNKPSVYSLFKELQDFTCYFPWYSGFTILDDYDLQKGLDKSNMHLQQCIINLVKYKEVYGIHDSDKNRFHKYVNFIDLENYKEEEIKPGNLLTRLFELIEKEIEPGEFLTKMERPVCQKTTHFKYMLHPRFVSIKEQLLVSICVNFCLQDIMDKLMESLQEQDLPEMKSYFTIQKFNEIKNKNPYMRRFKKNNFEDSYYFSPEIDLFALNKILEDLDKVVDEEHQKSVLRDLFRYFVQNNQDGNKNNIINFLYKKYRGKLKADMNDPTILELLTESIEKENKKENSEERVEASEKWKKIRDFLQNEEILYEVTENFGNLLVPFAFRKDIDKQFSRFDYSFIGLKLSNLRYILDKHGEFTATSLMYHEIHQIAAFTPLENYDSEIAQQRLLRVKNFFSSFIHIFATHIVSDKMSHIVEQKTASDITSKWAHALKTRIEFLKPIARSLKEKFPDNEEEGNKEGRNVVNILENRIMDLSKTALLIYEFSKDIIGNYDFLKEFNGFVEDFKNSPESYTRRHLVEILQDSISTALVRIITDDVYSVYIEARKKCFKREYFTERKIPRSEGNANRTLMELNLENQNELIFGEKGISRIDRSTIGTFLEDLYNITQLKGKFTVECDNELTEFLNYFILEESTIGGNDKRFPMSTMISLLFDEILLNALKYFDTNKDSETYVKINIEIPRYNFSGFRKGNGYLLPVTIKNSIGEEIKKENIHKDIRDYRTGIQSINMGFSMLQKEKKINYFNISDGKFFEYEFNIPVYLSGSDWASEYKSKGGGQ